MSARPPTSTDLPEPKAPRGDGGALTLPPDGDTIVVGRAAQAIDPWHIPPRLTRVDTFAKGVIDTLSRDDALRRAAAAAQRRIEVAGLANPLFKVTARLRRMGLDDVTSLLIANRTLYAATVGAALERVLSLPRPRVTATDKSAALAEEDGGSAFMDRAVRRVLEDDAGFASSILREIELRTAAPGLKVRFLQGLVETVAQARHLHVANPALVANALAVSGISLAPGSPMVAIENAIRRVAKEQLPRLWVDRFAQRDELKRHRFTEAIRKAMVRHLLDLGVEFAQINDADFAAGKFDEYFALAYSKALQSAGEAEEVSDDYQVRIFDDAFALGVDREAILGVGMLDYVYEIGERARVFDVLERLVLDHEAGLLGTLSPSSDPSLNGEADLGALLDREFDQMQTGQHLATEERAMYYRRALGKGDAEAFADAMINEEFSEAWDALILAAYQFIEKEERLAVDSFITTPISRTPIYEAVRELQRNLTQFGSGIGRRAKNLYARLDRAFRILEHPDTADYAGGGRPRTLVKTIERLAQQRLRVRVNATASFILAVDGNRIFRFIADFDPGTVSDESFREFLGACERYAIARGSRPEADESSDEEEQEQDEFADFDA